MAEPVFINQMITRILNGEVRIPSFQRGFVWDADRVAHLLDSIYKGYPFGTLLFWRTRTSLKTEKHLGPFQLPPPKVDYPIDYILDGQQRTTSIFGVFQSQLTPLSGHDSEWTRIHFDTALMPSAQDTQFAYLQESEVDPDRHFPLKLLFDPPKYRKFVSHLPDEIAAKIDDLYQRFTTAVIPVQSFSTDEKAAVAIVFERINRLGVKLDTLQLLSAWSWSDDFDLQEQFDELAEELAPFGFATLGEDSDLLLRCCAAIILHDASPNSIISLKGTDVRARFPEIKAGLKGAIDFLRANLNVYSIQVLPFTTLLVPLSVFFATNKDQATHPTAAQQERLTEWIWKTFFTRRYSKRLEQLNQDIKEVVRLRNQDPECALGHFPAALSESFFSDNSFKIQNVDTKTFVLLLASASPKDFLNCGTITLDSVLRECNKKEFHHLFPRAHLVERGFDDDQIHALANFCILPRVTNNRIGDRAPKDYRSMMPDDEREVDEILGSAICPRSLFGEDYAAFLTERKKMLVRQAKILMGV